MSEYPIWWDSTITLFNKFTDPETKIVKWYRTTINNCFWKYVNNRNSLGRYAVASDVFDVKSVICRIPKDERYIDIVEWINSKDKDRSKHFTLNTGDFIILGEVDDVIDEYTKGRRATDILAKYKLYNKSCEIETFTVDTGRGRCCEHYNIVGS